MNKKILKISSITMFILILLGLVVIFGTKFGYQLRVTAAEIIMSSQHRHWVKYVFLPQEEVEEILKSIQNPEVENTHESELSQEIIESLKNENEVGEKTSIQEVIEIYERRKAEREINEALRQNNAQLAEEIKETYETKISLNKNSKLKVEIKDINVKKEENYFVGKMATISNPFNVSIELSQGKQISESYGEQVSFIAQRHNAIIATNASGFLDQNGNGNGGTPIGIVISDGVSISDPGGSFAKDYIAGITNQGLLVTGYYSTDELLAMNVIDGAGFKPQLISNGKKMITEGTGGWGYGPRTAIGQKQDGSIVIIVIEGRQTHSLGASMKDVQDIMYEEGVVNALAMDGGSSAIMYYNGKNVTIPSSVNNIPRYVPTAWVVRANIGQEVEIYENGELVDSYTN